MSVLSLVLIVVASGLLIGGSAWIYPPAGLLVAGTLGMWFGIDLARDVPVKPGDGG